jgi:general secretion pathway protein K
VSRQNQRGAAVIMAMLVVAVTATLVGGVFWRQSATVRATENALAYAQAKWLMRGAVDWAGVILREDARATSLDHLGEAWSVPLAETRLNEGDGREPVYLSGQIRDEQAKLNLRNLVGAAGIDQEELGAVRRLLALLGMEPRLAERMAQRVLDGLPAKAGAEPAALGVASIDDFAEIAGMGPSAIERLRPFVTVLPQATPVNANTAAAEVLAARIRDLSLADARRLAASRDRAYFRDRADALSRLAELKLQASDAQIAVTTKFFSVDGSVIYQRARLQSRALLRREARRIDVLWLREAS